ncbi:MAG TPA: CBS domain-containing protein [Anaeromyxobacteraceae bacterium]|nr:CBS domain-containing protein [Anaeromyxobacteraceae bacterium]
MATIESHVTRELVALDAATPCAEAARVMTEERIGSVAVRQDGRVVGIVTERDLVSRVLADAAPPDLPIGRAMRTDLPRVTTGSTDTECIALMRDHAARHLLVVEGAEVVGIISMRDLIRLMLAEKEWLIDQLQSFIDGHDRPRAAAGN